MARQPPSPSRRPSSAPPKGVIGWTEWVEFPDWDIPWIKAKVDTGARTSALHVDRVEDLGDGHVRFDVVLHRTRRDLRVSVEARILRRTRIRASTGVWRRRYVVPALIRLGPVTKTIEVSLVSRDKMLFRMLLGRSAFSGDFLIDASRQCLMRRPRASRGASAATGRKARTR